MRRQSAATGIIFIIKSKNFLSQKEEEVRKRALQAAKKGKTLTFHWRGGYLTREMLAELLHIVEEEAVKKDKHAKVSLNWPQAVIRVSFAKELPAEDIVMEEANEGERN